MESLGKAHPEHTPKVPPAPLHCAVGGRHPPAQKNAGVGCGVGLGIFQVSRVISKISKMHLHHALLLASLGSVLAITCDPGEYAAPIRPPVRTGRRRRRSSSFNYQRKTCPPGTYMNLHAHNEGACFQCPSGMWADQTGATQCKGTAKCAAGSWGILGATAPSQPCHACSPGFVQPLAGQGECHPCQSGTYSAQSKGLSCTTANVASPDGCVAGTYGPIAATSASQATCTACATDTYTSHIGTETCQPCERGTYQPKPGQTQCIKAPRCERYYTWSTTEDKCVIRHKYLKYLSAVVWSTFLLNFTMKCYSDNWYTYFFIYNIIVCIGVGAASTRIGGELISDRSFYTMVGFLSIGTTALGVNLMTIMYAGLSKLSCVTLSRQQPRGYRGSVASVTELKRLDKVHNVV